MSAANVLIVEDEGLVAEEIALRVRQMGHHVAAIVDNAKDAFDFVATVHTDMWRPDRSRHQRCRSSVTIPM